MIASAQHKPGWKNAFFRHPKTVVIFIYIILSIGMTWPLSLNLNLSVFGDYGDTRGGIWGYWADIHGLRDTSHCDLLAAPLGSDMGSIPRQPVFEALMILPGKFIGEIAAYNLVILLAFPLTAFTTYILLNSLLNNKAASFAGGLIFGFNPGAVMQAVGGHANFAFNMFIPLMLLALFYNRSKRSFLSALFVGLSFALVTLNALYFGYFSLFVILFFIVFDLSTLENESKSKIVVNYFVIALFAVIFVLPFQYKMVLRQFAFSGGAVSYGTQGRNFSDLSIFSARPLEYLLPSIDHPLLGRFLINYSRENLHGSNLFEQTLYLGMIPLLLCMTGLVLWSQKTLNNTATRRYFLFFLLGALWMFFLSMPPFISIWSIKLPTVSYFMYKIAPMFRAYARFGILVNFFAACAAAVVLSVLSDRMQKGRYYLIVALLLPLLVFEYWNITPRNIHAISPPPAVYQWLASEPGDIVIAEYPMMKSDEASFYTYLFWQRIHKKRIVNGASPDNTKAWEFFVKVRDLTDPDTPRLLKSVGVKYVIVHQKMYKEGPIPEQLKRYYPPEASTATYNRAETYTDNVLAGPSMRFGEDVVYVL